MKSDWGVLVGSVHYHSTFFRRYKVSMPERVKPVSTDAAARRGGDGRPTRRLTKGQRQDVRWTLEQSTGVYAVCVHGVTIKVWHQNESQPSKPSRQRERANVDKNGTMQPSKRDATTKAKVPRIVTYGKAMQFLKGLVVRRWREAIEQWRSEREQQKQRAEADAAATAAAAKAAAAKIDARLALEKKVESAGRQHAAAAAEARRWQERFAECEQEREELRQRLLQLQDEVRRRTAQEQQTQMQTQTQTQLALTMLGEDDRAQKRAHESPVKAASDAGSSTPTTPTREGQQAQPPHAPKKTRNVQQQLAEAATHAA